MAELRRVYAPPEAFHDGVLVLGGERLRHVKTVLRLRPGDELAVTDGAGSEYRVRFVSVGSVEASAEILERAEPPRESPLLIVLAQALPKGDRFALVLEKAVELGVGGIIPVVSGRTVPAGGREQTLARWRRIAESATAQSGRTRLPELHPPRDWEALVGDPGLPELRLLLWERATAGLRESVEGRRAPRSVLVAVGPEGGVSDAEAARAVRAGFHAVRLGPRTLRTETAGIAALAALQHRWGDLG